MDWQAKNGGHNYLREWRQHRRMTQEELAGAVEPKTSTNMIQYLETGERGLSAKWLRRLADALRTTPGMILEHNPAEIDADLLETWLKSSPPIKRQIVEVTKAIVRSGNNNG